jgi:quinol monooxygenase YgiN
MIIFSLKINVPPEKITDAIQTVRSFIGWTCAQPGCISMVFYQDINDPDKMMLFEEWKEWDSLESHIRSDAFRDILEIMEISSEQPEIKFYEVPSTKGIEYIERVKTQ